ncbi:mRNA decapping complex subunit 2 [Auxenochlorella protothecoides]|uniref:mRNA decapping complex subunit 2 n=1 Tax=Auxenochlorella protothecoides TaxID=3075 RepID=A0A087SKX7_AUXPR|nr:mRNA decapping complex subunit 2 [Auxenochlorella protothecoides]KFM26381.1 mRNA decapping complex subunit 2 [Auxenochlorella protothecoides]
MVRPSAELLDEICVRFIINLPPEELESFERLLFVIEMAWWHYEDNIRAKDPTLSSLGLKEFCALIFDACPGLEPYRGSLDAIYSAFNDYKRAVPVRGVIMLDPTLRCCLVVRGWQEGASWGFPRGKLSKGESDLDCAAREVLEETGLDLRGRLSEQDCIARRSGAQDIRLYIVAGVDMDTQFAPQAKFEIGAYRWLPVEALPRSYDAERTPLVVSPEVKLRFFSVWQFASPLQEWIARKLAAPVKRQRRRNAGKGTGRLNDSCAALASLDTQLEHVREECDVPAAAQLYPTQAPIASEVKVQVVGMAPAKSFEFDREAVMRALHAGMGRSRH